MSIQIYNSLTKKKEAFVPINGKHVNMYSCGVTVYDLCHIGHARSLYVFDVIRRYLTYRGYQVHFVRNITDIDDKIINKSLEAKMEWKDVVRDNIAAYHEDLKRLTISQADEEPCATDNIPEMISHIQGLLDKGCAYASGGNVYFDVRKFAHYGKLSGQSVDKMLEAVRIDEDAHKRDPLDFAMWKASKEGEPSWESPWGPGRPGWHIECSCMSMKYLKTQTLDIHAGGRDLIFPHHENEIAQSEALTGKPFAKYWIHHGLLTINGQKMSKSLGNFITVQDALKKYNIDELKFLFLMSHYSSPVDFNEEKMMEAKKGLERIRIFLKRGKGITRASNSLSVHVANSELKFIEKSKSDFESAMDDDFNTPKALASIFDLISKANRFLDEHHQDQDCVQRAYEASERLIIDYCKNLFNLDMTWQELLASDEEGLLEERRKAREQKDFKRSDEIRGLLLEKGIIVEDTKEGQVWRRS